MKTGKYDIILDAAKELMCSKDSVADITVDMIAKQAGIGKGSIYYYFISKEEIIDAVIDQCYSVAIEDFIAEIKSHKNSLEKLKLLFQSILSSELKDKSRNVIRELHLQNDIVTNYKLMMASIKVISPIVTELLVEGTEKGELHAEFPEESSRMIIAMLTFLLDNYFFPNSDENRLRSLKLYSQILETCLKTKPGSFDFLTQPLN
ncbi:MAG: TetR/AcrR family transcriptional regulator [Oscillospiraceae bacterium]|nr:TetR/AcrR family transcriptional regulator [Oscillospiraceae bacterium]